MLRGGWGALSGAAPVGLLAQFPGPQALVFQGRGELREKPHSPAPADETRTPSRQAPYPRNRAPHCGQGLAPRWTYNFFARIVCSAADASCGLPLPPRLRQVRVSN